MEESVVREIEDVSARAWPPLHQRDVDGWLLRASGGVTGRANSVSPRADNGGLTLDEKLSAAGEFYAGHELPLLVQITPTSKPDGLADELVARGYGIARAARSVQVADLDAVAAIGDPARADVSDAVSDTWYDVVAQVNASFDEHRRAARGLLSGVKQPSAFALVTVDGVPASAGRGVYDGDWLGVYNMATLPAYRRQGCAAALLSSLALWARERGARRAYLQMDGDNTAAPQLYVKAGFTPCYEYAFWGRR